MRSAEAGELIADRPDVVRALKAAQGPLKKGIADADRDHVGLWTYAAMKIGVPKDDVAIVAGVDRVAAHCANNSYAFAGGNHAIYVAGIEAMLLADFGGSKYAKEVALIRDFVVSRQNANGSWTYEVSTGADMSVSQYALLGLWAAERAGASVEKVVWAKAARFLLAVDKNGGYGYRPTSNDLPTLNMTGAGLTGLAICRRYLAGGFRAASLRSRQRTDKSEVLYGILRPVVPEVAEEVDAPKPASKPIDPNLRVDRADLDRAVDKSAGWIDGRFAVLGDSTRHLSYWFYTLERAGALTGQQMFKGVDWYNETADAILARQATDGTWNFSNYDRLTDTSLTALFLARPTRKLTGQPITVSIGGGLLSGGRGLPADLTEFGRPATSSQEAAKTELEKLLADLSDADETSLPKLQEQLITAVQTTSPEELIGQNDQLVELVRHRNADVRRTALWAIGRTGELRLARYAIGALDDRDPTVLTEARNALAWIARSPNAFGHREDPLAGVAPGATIDEKVQAVERWRTAMLKTWGSWYLKNCPYDDRFDEFDLDLRRRLRRL